MLFSSLTQNNINRHLTQQFNNNNEWVVREGAASTRTVGGRVGIYENIPVYYYSRCV